MLASQFDFLKSVAFRINLDEFRRAVARASVHLSIGNNNVLRLCIFEPSSSTDKTEIPAQTRELKPPKMLCRFARGVAEPASRHTDMNSWLRVAFDAAPFTNSWR
ncbi:hypothetical protein LJR230_002120 [Trinickia sp. LjRoot230]|uniref:hypothetical protein n=1 Tax=Trinickia sp. LjRoot230 TaxID=3342288 RepID=UPI003ECE0F7F